MAAAFLSELGLSTKGMKDDVTEADASFAVDTEVMTSPPMEERLIQGTLWQESNKLYAHGDNMITIASTPSSVASACLIASACKARSPEEAGIRVWDGSNGKVC